MGIEVLSFTIKDVYDTVTYLASLGKFLRYIKIMYAITIGLAIAKYQAEIITDELQWIITVLKILGKAQTAAVKRDAEIGVAQVLIIGLNVKHLKFLLLWPAQIHYSIINWWIFRPTGTPEFARQNAKRLQWMSNITPILKLRTIQGHLNYKKQILFE